MQLLQIIFFFKSKLSLWFCLQKNTLHTIISYFLSISIKSISYLFRMDSIYTCGYHSNTNFLWSNLTGCYWWSPLNHTYEHIIALRQMLSNFTCEGSDACTLYKARLDMKSHKNILYQTHMLFQRPREWYCYLSISLFRPHIPWGCCDCYGINHTNCLMKDSVWISKFQDLYIMRRADMSWSFLWVGAKANCSPKWPHH